MFCLSNEVIFCICYSGWKDVTEEEHAIIKENFLRHRPFQPFQPTETLDDEDNSERSYDSGSFYSDDLEEPGMPFDPEYSLADSRENWASLRAKIMFFLESALRQCTRCQATLLARISDSIDQMEDGHSGTKHLVQGKAGTGKSFIIRIISLLVRIKLYNYTSIPITRCSPTGTVNRLVSFVVVHVCVFNIGIVASAMKGQTIHKVFQIPCHEAHADYMELLGGEKETQLKTSLRKIRVLIIDEISMVGRSSRIECFDLFSHANH